jgi:Na+-transporting methylmalonyl-CoA/oxaloacetate decarboxylase gamma subunit
MKHPFFTLYYTGIGIFISIFLVLGLLTYNISNISQILFHKTPEPTPSEVIGDAKILRELPLEKKVVTPKTNPKPTIVNEIQNSQIVITKTLEEETESTSVQEVQSPNDSL